jgi:hypothetical protein
MRTPRFRLYPSQRVFIFVRQCYGEPDSGHALSLLSYLLCITVHHNIITSDSQRPLPFFLNFQPNYNKVTAFCGPSSSVWTSTI